MMFLLLVTALAISSATAQNATSNFTCGPSPFGEIPSLFNGFFFNDFSVRGDVEGRLAVGGNAKISGGVGYLVYPNVSQETPCDQLPAVDGWDSPDTLVVGGNLRFKQGRVFKGNVVYGGNFSSGRDQPTINPNCAIIQNASRIDFAYWESHLTNLSQSYALLAPTGYFQYVTNGAGQIREIVLFGSQSETEVFALSGNIMWSTVKRISLRNVTSPGKSTIIINIDGTVTGFENLGQGDLDPYHQQIIFNFHEATLLRFRKSDVKGTVLAPLATIPDGPTEVLGHMFAKNFYTTLQLRDFPFCGPEIECTDCPGTGCKAAQTPCEQQDTGNPCTNFTCDIGTGQCVTIPGNNYTKCDLDLDGCDDDGFCRDGLCHECPTVASTTGDGIDLHKRQDSGDNVPCNGIPISATTGDGVDVSLRKRQTCILSRTTLYFDSLNNGAHLELTPWEPDGPKIVHVAAAESEEARWAPPKDREHLKVFRKTGLTGEYTGRDATTMLEVVVEKNVNNKVLNRRDTEGSIPSLGETAVTARVLYDFTGDGSIDRSELWGAFIEGMNRLVKPFHVQGEPYQALKEGTVVVEIWQDLNYEMGAETDLIVGSGSFGKPTTVLSLPFSLQGLEGEQDQAWVDHDEASSSVKVGPLGRRMSPTVVLLISILLGLVIAVGIMVLVLVYLRRNKRTGSRTQGYRYEPLSVGY